jgi:putative transposase
MANRNCDQDEVDGRSLLDEIAREGARRTLVAALETDVAAYLETHRDERDEDGQQDESERGVITPRPSRSTRL